MRRIIAAGILDIVRVTDGGLAIVPTNDGPSRITTVVGLESRDVCDVAQEAIGAKVRLVIESADHDVVAAPHQSVVREGYLGGLRAALAAVAALPRAEHAVAAIEPLFGVDR